MRHFNNFFILLFTYLLLTPHLTIAEHINFKNTASKNLHAIVVLNQRGTKASKDKWNPLIDYLNETLANVEFYLVPLNHIGIQNTIARQNPSIIITDAIHSSQLQAKKQYKPILSLINTYKNQAYNHDAGLIITRANHPNIHQLKDVLLYKIISSSQKSLSFNSAWHHLQNIETSFLKSLKPIDFLGFPEDEIVYALQDNQADIGIISAGLLEKMHDENKINIKNFKILNAKQDKNYHLLHSTYLYLPWALNINIHLPDISIKNIQKALLQQKKLVLFQQENLPKYNLKNTYYWEIAKDYQTINKNLQNKYSKQKKDLTQGYYTNSPITILVLIMVLLCLFLSKIYYVRHPFIIYSFTLSLLILIAIIFYQVYTFFISDYHIQQVEIAKSNVEGTAATINTYLTQKKLTLQRFSLENKQLLQNLFVMAQYPTSPQRILFEKNLKMQFPDLLKYAVFDNDKQLLYSSKKKVANSLCEKDISFYLRIGKQKEINLHGCNDATYHFDLTIRVNNQFIIIISIKIWHLLETLKNSKITTQNLIIVKNNKRTQIVFSASGTKKSTNYGQYLDIKSQSKHIYGRHIDETDWYLEALIENNWLQQYEQNIRTWMILIYAFICLILLVFVWRLTKETNLRQYLETNHQQQSNQRYKILLEHTVDAFISTDEYGDIDEFNPAAERMLGYDKKSIQQQNFRVFMPEEQIMQEFNVFYLRTYLDKQTHPNLGYHLKARHKHGYNFPVYMTLMDTGISGSYRYGIMLKDMTVLKLSEERLNAARQRLQYALDGANEGYLDWDINSGKVYFSSSWENILGYQSGELVPHINTLKDRIHRDDKVRVEKLLQAHFEGKNEYYKVEYRLKNKQGDWIWILGRGKVVSRDALGQPLRMVGTTSNIQERKNLEHALQQSKVQTEKSAAAKSQFLSNMSHEIRTPLNGVLGMAQLLEKTELNKQQQKYIKLILESGDALMVLINDILDLNKLENKKIKQEYIAFNLEDLLYDILYINRQFAYKKGIFLLLDYSCDVPYLFLGNPYRIKQIIDNLINNAVKFTHKGSIRICVSQLINNNTDSKQRIMKITVTDTGIGIAKNKQKQIFKNFTQADHSTHRKYGGTGLGLAICKQLIKQMQGKIYVKSKIQKGSCFSLNIPLKLNTVAKSFHCIKSLNNTKIMLFNSLKLSRKIFIKILKSAGAIINIVKDSSVLINSLKADINLYDILIFVNHDLCFNRNTFKQKLDSICPLLPVLYINIFDKHTDINYLYEPYRHQSLIKRIQQLIQPQNQIYKEQTNQVLVSPQPESVKASYLKNRLILIVEDIPLNQLIVVDMLKNIGINTDCVNDGIEGITAWKTGKYDLILMDCRMPNMDGYTATQKIRELEQQENKKPTPIVALTANALLEDIKKCSDVGMDDILTKPLKQEKLEQVITHVFKSLEKTIVSHSVKVENDKTQSVPIVIENLLATESIKQLKNNLKSNFDKVIQCAVESLGELNQQLNQQLFEIKQIPDDQYVESIRLSHSLKSTAQTIGLYTLGAQAENLEHQLGDLSFENITKHIVILNQLQKQSIKVLNEYLITLND